MTDVSFSLNTMKKLYACDTTTFKRLNRYAVRTGYNRSMSDEGIAQLDPLGNHILENVLSLHTNHAGLVSMRARCLTKLTGKAAPTVVFLDISHKDWRKFVEHNSVLLEQEPEGKVVAAAAAATETPEDEDDEDLWMEIYSETDKFAELCGEHKHLKPYHNFRYLQCWGGGPEGGFLTDGTTLHKVNRMWGNAFTVFPQPGTLKVELRNGVKQCRIVL